MHAERQTRVLLLSMPFGAIDRPALGLSLLKPALAARGFVCDVRYLNFVFADYAGGNEYRWAMNDLPYTAFAGDWTFTESLYGPDAARDAAYVETILRGTWNRGDDDVARLRNLRELVEPFLAACLASVPFGDYDVVGFTSTFEQNIASLSFARRLKELFPAIRTVFGGANWEVPMGLALHRQFPFVDYVCSGEADESFPTLIEAIEAFGDDFAPPAGVVARRGGQSVFGGPAPLVRAMDDLPVPDFSDYFRDLELSGSGVDAAPSILFESSRGCWWGAKSHCTFCGLNGGSMAFRSKSPGRVLAELDELVGRWPIENVEAVDNILDAAYFKELIPALAARRGPLRIFYEVKANLSREQVALLSRAGIYRIQPGIESMSDHVLQLMRKGTTALRNVQLLKWCSEFGIGADWNILYGFPGETVDDYAGMLELLRSIDFLPPPSAVGPIRLDRFSPYFNTPASFGLTNVRPLPTYQFLYPDAGDALGDIANYFEFDYGEDVDPTGRAAAVIAFATDWMRAPHRGDVVLSETADGAILIHDSRPGALIPSLLLRGLEKEAYLFCDEMHTASAVAAHLRERFADIDGASVVECLDSLVANRLMITDGTHYLSVAVHQPARYETADRRIEAFAGAGANADANADVR